MKKTLAGVLLFMLCAAGVRAQSGPVEGAHELEVWTGGGRSVAGGIRDIGVWNSGFRYGWILTQLHGPGFLRGRFEYAVDVVPAFLISQPTGTAYGFEVNPVVLKWNFQERRNIVPYVEASSGPLFTNHDVPAGISKVNFASSGAVGLYFLRPRYGLSMEVRFMHISDAGLTSPNPGINTLQARLGFSFFRKRR